MVTKLKEFAVVLAVFPLPNFVLLFLFYLGLRYNYVLNKQRSMYLLFLIYALILF